MADENELAQGADDTTVTDPNAAPAEPVDTGEPPEPNPIEDLAKEMGWTPKDQFSGPEEAWKPADQFIRDGRDIQRSYRQDIKRLEGQLDNIVRTNGTIMAQTLKDQAERLTARYNELVEDGKGAEAFKVAQEIQGLQDTARNGVAPPQPGVSTAAADFAAQNSSWFRKDPLATARAIEISNTLAGQGYDEATQLKYARETVEREMPHLFGKGANGAKPMASVNAPGARGSQRAPNEKTFAAMPKAAQDVAADMERRGLIKRDDYVRNYFANLEGKA